MKTLHTSKTLSMLGLAALMAFPGMAQERARTGSGTISAQDRQFMQKAAQGGLAEVQFGELAERNASSDKVKDFARRMVKDHTDLNNELKAIAATKGIDLPSSMSADDQAKYDSLSKMSGEAFDKVYISGMIEDHKTDIQEFEDQSTNGTDPDLKAFASKALPTLRDHLAEAKKIADHIGLKTHGQETGQ